MAIEFQKGFSTLHKLDARTKLLLFVGLTILAVVVVDPIIIAVMFFALHYLGTKAIDPRLLNRNLRVLVFIFLTFSIFQILFFTPKEAVILFYLIPGSQWIAVTVQGIIRGGAVFFRFFIVVLSVHLMLYTTPPVELVLAVTQRERRHSLWNDIGLALLIGGLVMVMALLAMPEEIQRIQLAPFARMLVVYSVSLLVGYVIYTITSHGLPPEMGVALSLGFATVGILSQQTQKITDAQKARGYDVRPKNLIRRVQVLTALLMPIFLATLERSQDISVAILARGFDYNIANRTYRRQLTFHAYDYIVMVIIVALILGAMLLNYLAIGNPTEQFILNLIAN